MQRLINCKIHTKKMVFAPTITLNNGQKCPQIGLGTWLAEHGELETAIKYAIDFGYRHFDCAWVYGNEKEVGKAVRSKITDGTVKREELFIVTKLWNMFHEKEKVVPTLKESLANLGLDYVDLYLIHWPVAQKKGDQVVANDPFGGAVGFDYDYVDTWKGMEECVKLDLTKGIGLSNFNSKQVERILANCTIKPVINQIEVSPNINQKKFIEFLKSKSIAVTAYSPLGSPTRPWAIKDKFPRILDKPQLAEIGEKYGKSPAQVILRYLTSLGVIAIPKATNNKRIEENISIFDFNLNAEETAIMDSFNCNRRAILAPELQGLPNYPFEEEEKTNTL